MILTACLLAWNALAFLVMGWDKHRAKSGGWRVPEKTLFFFAFCFAGPGVLLGMKSFRHKTKHTSFRIGVPAGILLDAALIWGALQLFGNYVR